MRTACVGTKSQVSATELQALIQQLSKAIYFGRTVDKVSGFCTNFDPEKLTPTGQVFNQTAEIRWQQKGDSYDILWLGIEPAQLPPGFTAMEGDWCCDLQDLQAKVYPPTETKLPRRLRNLPDEIDIKQRYFRDRQTSTIHFTALTYQ